MNEKLRELLQRITDCLAKGGLWNMEVMEAGKVRDLLIDCRHALASSETPQHNQLTGLSHAVNPPLIGEPTQAPQLPACAECFSRRVVHEKTCSFYSADDERIERELEAPALPPRDEQLQAIMALSHQEGHECERRVQGSHACAPNGVEIMAKRLQEAQRQGRKQATEEAAQVANNCDSSVSPGEIAWMIRSLASQQQKVGN